MSDALRDAVDSILQRKFADLHPGIRVASAEPEVRFVMEDGSTGSLCGGLAAEALAIEAGDKA